MLGLLWQPIAALLPAGVDVRAEQLAHAVVHDEARGHHHHEDASPHLDAAAEVAHQHVLDGGQPPGLLAGSIWLEAMPPASGIDAPTPSVPPSVVLEGPLRPPCAYRA